jgi:hypothetical protein
MGWPHAEVAAGIIFKDFADKTWQMCVAIR